MIGWRGGGRSSPARQLPLPPSESEGRAGEDDKEGAVDLTRPDSFRYRWLPVLFFRTRGGKDTFDRYRPSYERPKTTPTNKQKIKNPNNYKCKAGAGKGAKSRWGERPAWCGVLPSLC
ncbi:UNVERIFIED_CONTAM: hypothetical protein K2H54_014706 [Gekko kuhli]